MQNMASFDDNSSSNINDDSENSRMSIVSNNSETEMASTSFANILNPSENTIERESLEEEYKKRSYLDGTWFVPDLSKSTSTGKVYGICQMCKVDFNKHSVISGNLNSSSNFKTHLKVKCFEQ